MTTEEAIRICEKWFIHLEIQRQKAVLLKQAATLARLGETIRARHIKAGIDSQPKVFDGAYLEPAVKHLVDIVKEE